MTTLRAAALGRAFGKPVLSGVLVFLLLLSALASASPCLHERLHADHQSPIHHCLVTTLEHGQSDVATVAVLVPPPTAGRPLVALPGESFFIAHDIALHPERGPPVLS
jgi:hypothetical protein